jgi:hypothetical protein
LASIGSIVLGTGGSFGVEDIVAQTFYQETQRLLKTNEVLHVLSQEKVKYFSPPPPFLLPKTYCYLPVCLSQKFLSTISFSKHSNIAYYHKTINISSD